MAVEPGDPSIVYVGTWVRLGPLRTAINPGGGLVEHRWRADIPQGRSPDDAILPDPAAPGTLCDREDTDRSTDFGELAYIRPVDRISRFHRSRSTVQRPARYAAVASL
jgi:hypothetical protein